MPASGPVNHADVSVKLKHFPISLHFLAKYSKTTKNFMKHKMGMNLNKLSKILAKIQDWERKSRASAKFVKYDKLPA